MSDQVNKDNIIPFPVSHKNEESTQINNKGFEERLYQNDLDTINSLNPYVNESTRLRLKQEVAKNAGKSIHDIEQDLIKRTGPVDPKE